MDVTTMRNILESTDQARTKFAQQFEQSRNYYQTKNDITNKNQGSAYANLNKTDEKDKNGVRNADNRVPSNYHQLIVDQEASYLATTPPDIDTQNDGYNQKIKDTLGTDFPLILNQLVIDAANAGTAWLHYWKDSEDKKFKYATVTPSEVTPIYTTDLTPKLKAVRRSYSELDTETGKSYMVHEYWTEDELTVFKSTGTQYEDTLMAMDDRIIVYDTTTNEPVDATSHIKHGLGSIPFIEFDKNRYKRPDLLKYKGYIDTYDLIYNGLINDLQDIQQVILILTNYGGAPLSELRKTIREEKALKFNSSGPGDKSGLDTLKIDIPTEAKQLALELTNKKIFKFGQGIDPDDFLVEKNATGPALKMLYSHLELKASQTEQYFRRGIDELARAIIRNVIGTDFGDAIAQTWHRASIRNDYEQAQIVQMLAGVTSKENVAKANPIVPDWKLELEKQKDEATDDPFSNQEELEQLRKQMEQNKAGD